LSPRAFCRLLQYDDARAPTASCFVPRAAGRGDEPSPAFAFVRPLAGTARADEPLSLRLRRGVSAWTGPERVKVRAVVSAGEAPPRTSTAHLVRRTSTATKGGTSRAFCSHRVCTPRKREVPTARSPFPASPREGRCVSRKPRCVLPSCAWTIPRIAPRFHPSGPLFHAAPVPRRTPTLCRLREPAPL